MDNRSTSLSFSQIEASLIQFVYYGGISHATHTITLYMLENLEKRPRSFKFTFHRCNRGWWVVSEADKEHVLEL